MRVPSPLKSIADQVIQSASFLAGTRTCDAQPGRAGHAIVPDRPSGFAARSTQWRCRATLAVKRSGAAVHTAKEAAGVPSAWSQPLNQPPRDHADGATLGRRVHPASQKAGAPGSRQGTPTGTAQPQPHVTLSGAASEAAESKGPPIQRGGPLRERRSRTCGDLSTRSRTLSLKVTCSQNRIRARGKHSPPGRAGYVIVLVRPTGAAEHSALLRYRALHGQTVPVHLSRLQRRPPAHEQRGRSPSTLPPRDHAARATLGRRAARRPRRPFPIEPWTYAPRE